MGPRFFKRGDLTDEVIDERPVNASMGPRFFKRGDTLNARDLYDVRFASMGPRFFKRGDARSMPVPNSKASTLQWGHASLSVETESR